MKQCAKCGRWLDEKYFNWRWEERDVLQSICRDCSREQRHEYYESHKEEVKAKARETKREAIERAQQFIYEYLSNQVCVDCGEYDFAVLTFDHVRGKKKMDVSTMAAEGYSIDAIREEIAKCEVVCMNCHFRRKNERRSGGRFRRFWPKWPG